jgi:hypothetical protein
VQKIVTFLDYIRHWGRKQNKREGEKFVMKKKYKANKRK